MARNYVGDGRDKFSTHIAAGENIIFQGPAGIGKTRLASELVAPLAKMGRRIDRLLASESTKDHQFAVLAPLGAPTGVMPGDVPGLLSWYLAQWRTAARSGQPPLVWIDDAQHLDGLTASLIRQAVSGNVIQALVTHRSTEPLPAEILAMTTEGLLTPHLVEPLMPESTRQLIDAASTAEIDADRVERIVDLANGNPLFALELTTAANTGHTITDSPSLRSVIGQRFRPLTPELRRTVELVALTEPIDPSLLPQRRAEISELRAAGLLITHGESLRLDHPLHGAWLLENIDSDHDHFAELLDNAPRDASSSTRLSWTLRANREPDADLAAEAARELLILSDGRGLLHLIEFLPNDQRNLIEAKALMLVGQLDDGLALLDQVRHTGVPEERVDAASWMAKYLGVMLGQYETAHQVLAEVDHPGLAVPLRRILLNARQWLWIFGTGNSQEFLQLALDLTEPEHPVDHSSFDVLTAASSLCHHQWTAEESQTFLDRASEVAQLIDVEREAHYRFVATSGGIQLFGGKPLAAASIHKEGVHEAAGVGSAEGVGLLAANACYAYALGGKLIQAVEFGELCRQFTIAIDPFRLGVVGNWVLAAAYVLKGDLDAGSAVVERTQADTTDGSAVLESLFRARALALLGDSKERSANSGELVEIFSELKGHAKLAFFSTLALEILDSSFSDDVHSVVRDTLWHFAPEVPVQGVVRTAAAARLERSPMDILECAKRTQDFPAASTRAAADAIRFAPDDEAIRHQATRLIVQAQCRWDGGPMWWLGDIEGLPTERQIDIASRVAAGIDVRGVADQLHLSKRTVENHLYRFTRAVGMQGTDELGQLFTAFE